MTPHPTSRRLLVGVAAALLALGTVGCGSDDDGPSPQIVADPTADPTADPGTDPTSEDPLDGPVIDDGSDLPDLGGGDPAARLAAQCDAYVELGAAVAGLADRDVVTVAEDFAEVAPIDIGTYAEALATAIVSAGSDPNALTSDETMDALAQVGNFFFDQCELDDRHQLIATEEGVPSFPETVKAGRVGIELANMTTDDEPVQLVLARRDDDDPRTAEELSALTADQLAEDHDPVAVLWTESSDHTVAWLYDLEPGSYLAVSSRPSGGEDAVSVVIFEATA